MLKGKWIVLVGIVVISVALAGGFLDAKNHDAIESVEKELSDTNSESVLPKVIGPGSSATNKLLVSPSGALAFDAPTEKEAPDLYPNLDELNTVELHIVQNSIDIQNIFSSDLSQQEKYQIVAGYQNLLLQYQQDALQGLLPNLFHNEGVYWHSFSLGEVHLYNLGQDFLTPHQLAEHQQAWKAMAEKAGWTQDNDIIAWSKMKLMSRFLLTSDKDEREAILQQLKDEDTTHKQ